MENKTLNRETYAIIKSSLFPYTSIHNTHPDTQTDYYQNQNLFINVFEAISLRARARERTRRIHRFMVWLKLLNSKRLLMAPKTKSTLFQWTEMNQDFLEPIEDDNNCCGNQHFWYEMRQDNGRKKKELENGTYRLHSFCYDSDLRSDAMHRFFKWDLCISSRN